MLPVGQQLWLKELKSYIEFPPLQDPASYNLVQVLEQVKKMGGGTRANDREESPTIDGRRSMLGRPLISTPTSVVGTSVWTGRALQVGYNGLEIVGLAHLYSAL